MITLFGEENGDTTNDTYSQESLAGSPFQTETAVAPTCLSQRDNTCQGFLTGTRRDTDWIVFDISMCSFYFLILFSKAFI